MHLQQKASHAINLHRMRIMELAVSKQYDLKPDPDSFHGERGREKCRQDVDHHLDYLTQALVMQQPALFTDYLMWARIMLESRDTPVEDLVTNLSCLADAFRVTLPGALAESAVEYLEKSQIELLSAPADIPSFIAPDGPLNQLASEYLAAVLRGDRQEASRLVLLAVESGTGVEEIYLNVFQASQREIGRLWQTNAISVAQEHYCTAATQLIMSQLYPYLFSGPRTGRTLVATCVAGDTHEIGIRMVSDIFELHGWDTYYLGANTPAVSIIQSVIDQQADVLAISATIAPQLKAVQELIEMVRASPECQQLKVMVGGHPFHIAPDLWRQIGADATASDAASSVAVANELTAAAGLSTG